MQTLDFVSGLHNCREFSQPLSCLYQAMQTQEKSFLFFHDAQNCSVKVLALFMAYFSVNRNDVIYSLKDSPKA